MNEIRFARGVYSFAAFTQTEIIKRKNYLLAIYPFFQQQYIHKVNTSDSQFKALCLNYTFLITHGDNT
jgi:hypothetical protein